MNNMLIRDVEENELMQATFELEAMKAPGLDGFKDVFYENYLKIVKECVV